MQHLVYRKGSNAANQPMTFDWVPIAIVEAESQEDAERTTWGGAKPDIHGCPTLEADIVASAGNVDVWSNQYVKAVAEANLTEQQQEDWNSVLEADAMASHSSEQP